ncbi:MAG: winged helix-turn-helix domain-containing protein [Proteobacteria bacterium]|nr:winged helix-turn-helix domain-containing protein [Pseudomonadota bacterium]
MLLPRIRFEIVYALTKEPGLPYAETARQLGVSNVAISKMMKKESSHEHV